MNDNHTTLSKLIKELEEFKKRFGDLPVTFVNGYFQPVYPVIGVSEGSRPVLCFNIYGKPQRIKRYE